MNFATFPKDLLRNFDTVILYCTVAMGLENIVAYLLKVRTVEPEKQPLLGNACTQQ
jgi:hypothetical protein